MDMHLIVLTPDRKIFEGKIKLLKVPGTTGYFEVMKGHAPIVSSLGEGSVKIKIKEGSEKSFQIEDGFIEVLNDQISLLVTGVKE